MSDVTDERINTATIRLAPTGPEGDTDLSDGVDTAGRVAVDGSATGEIDYGGDRDWFAVELEAGHTYRFDLEGAPTGAGTLSDPYLRGIHDASGNLIGGTADNNRGQGRNARGTFTADRSGTYYVSAGAWGNREGTYKLTVTDQTAVDAHTEDADTTGTVAVDGSATGEIDYGGDRDWFAVELEAGHTYRFDLEGASTGAGTLSDPYLRGIHDASGNLIGGTADNNRGQGRNARKTFTADRSGTYYVSAGAWGNREGTYKLTVTDQTAVDAHTEDADTTGTVAVDGSATGEIDYGGDRDWFAVELEAGHTYRFDLEGASTGAGTLSDPYLRGIHDASGNLIGGTADNNRGQGRNARKTFTADRSGTYYVSAGAWGNREGTYKLTVTDVNVNVTDVDEAPAFAEARYDFELAENADGSSARVALGTVSATDPEGSSLTYSIVHGNDADLFEIDAATGALSYKGTGEDYESGTTSHELTVRTSDGGLHSDVAVTVNVTNVDEAPAFAETSYAFALEENADGSETGVALGTVSAADPEGLAPTYSIVGGNESGLFEIDPATGALSYTGTGEDHESGTTRYALTVRASDDHRHSDVRVTVNVTDVDEEPAFGATSYAFELAENAEGGTNRVVLGTVSATDPENSALTYSITGGNGESLFGIDAATGEVYYTGSGEDHESGTASHELTVRASDDHRHSDVRVTVNVTDVDEEPAFADQSYAFDLEENADGSETGVTLGTVSAADPEGLAPTYSIVGGNESGLFEIDPATGALSYTGTGEDHESGTTRYALTVRASAGGQFSDVRSRSTSPT